MTEFSFRIRAMDNAGAFADRDFSIKVRNTVTDRLVLVDGTNAYTSPDGVNWTTRASMGGNGVSHGGGNWLVWSTTGSSTYRTSPDGVNWTNRTLPNFNGGSNAAHTNHFVYANGRWMGFWCKSGGLTNDRTAFFSLDGVTWTEGGTITGAAGANRIAYGNGRWVIGSTSTTQQGWTSTDDGVTWTPFTTGLGGSNHDSIYVNGLWILVDFTSSRVQTSSNFTTWTARSLPGITGNPYRITYGNGRLAISTYFGGGNTLNTYDKVMTSEDGVTWTARSYTAFKAGSTGDTGTSLVSIIYTHGQFFMSATGGSNAGLRVSNDGITWTKPSSPTGFYTGMARMSLS
jgi:hypothetical protein